MYQINNLPPSSILLITGIMAAGKSTVAQRAAERLPKSVHLRGDVFRRMIVNGQAEINADLQPEAVEQLKLRYSLAATAAEMYCRAGFAVVYQDIILGNSLTAVIEMLKHRPLYVVVLCPSPEVVVLRESGRGKVGYGSWTPHDLDQSLRQDTPKIGLWLDSSALSVDETVDAIFAQFPQTTVGIQ